MAEGTAGTVAAVIVAASALQRLRQQKEEEENALTAYGAAEDWEFKIVRSISGFRKPQRLRAMLVMEALAGWELLEKLDDNRVRLRRKTSQRAADATRAVDAYRTNYGASQWTIALLSVLVAVVLVVALFVFLAS